MRSPRLTEAAPQHRRERIYETTLPGFTHMQHAAARKSGPSHLLAYFWMFARDRARLEDCLKRVAQLPLGSAALAGTSFCLDRESVARELGFCTVFVRTASTRYPTATSSSSFSPQLLRWS